MTLLAGPIHPITIPEPEQGLARSSSESLSHLVPADEEPVKLRFDDPQSGAEMEATIPAAALRVLTQALAQMAQGHPVTLVPLQAELSTQQGADLLGVSRPYFVKLLEQGRIPFRKVGEQRRVRYQDLLRYVEEQERAGAVAAVQMTADAEALGLYDDHGAS
jgi:excisionase family DNA binding protein